ncbi:protein kinase family protein [Acetobacterium tundrae]|uniref:Protein kinase n=1 Tax=Acetobacterium tundrae TaxID=132932 RepID=A0ABR6WNW4_9FIRM|nr:protein kinase family protein [Acetobacterium tundrae]MBC3798097.1 protein kinase [Acetobacterium tundrae]
MKNNGDIVPFIKQKDYIMVNNVFGGGSFAKTVLLQDPFIDELFVAKKYEPLYEGLKEKFYKNFLDEIKILYKLNHRNIVRIYNYYAYEDVFTGYILMEYIDGANIEEYITEYTGIGDPVTLDDLFMQLIDGFCYIEEHSIIHRDIREGNILIDKFGTVKVIDFGIGKIFEKSTMGFDSLVTEINRKGSDTLPQEYFEGFYTSQTDMFYLAELVNRLLKGAKIQEMLDFSYQDILNKMMEKLPVDRFENFVEIKGAMGKHDFINMKISKEDKVVYQKFVNLIYKALSSFTDEQKFNYDSEIFIAKLEKALRDNLFEEVIHKNADVINSVVSGSYKYNNHVDIPCTIVKDFLDWFKKSMPQSQKLILTNIISKLSMIDVVEEESEVPF